MLLILWLVGIAFSSQCNSYVDRHSTEFQSAIPLRPAFQPMAGPSTWQVLLPYRASLSNPSQVYKVSLQICERLLIHNLQITANASERLIDVFAEFEPLDEGFGTQRQLPDDFVTVYFKPAAIPDVKRRFSCGISANEYCADSSKSIGCFSSSACIERPTVVEKLPVGLTFELVVYPRFYGDKPISSCVANKLLAPVADNRHFAYQLEQIQFIKTPEGLEKHANPNSNLQFRISCFDLRQQKSGGWVVERVSEEYVKLDIGQKITPPICSSPIADTILISVISLNDRVLNLGRKIVPSDKESIFSKYTPQNRTILVIKIVLTSSVCVLGWLFTCCYQQIDNQPNTRIE